MADDMALYNPVTQSQISGITAMWSNLGAMGGGGGGVQVIFVLIFFLNFDRNFILKL
jgi:hypothetical protein